MSAAEELCPSGDARAVRLPPHVVTLWHEWRLRAVKAAWDRTTCSASTRTSLRRLRDDPHADGGATEGNGGQRRGIRAVRRVRALLHGSVKG